MACLKKIQNDLGLVIRNEGESLKQLAYKRNEAIHFFITNSEKGMEQLHYTAFEDFWIFLFRDETSKYFNSSEMKSIARKLGLRFRKVKENVIDSFTEAMDEKNDNLKEEIRLLVDFRKGIIQKLYIQELSFLREGDNYYHGWEEMKFGDVCSLKIARPNVASLPRLVTKDGIVSIDKTGDKEGRVLFELVPKQLVTIDYITFIIDANKLFLRRLHVGSNFRGLPLKDILNLRINVPSLIEQNKITSFLNSIDMRVEQLYDKLELQMTYEKEIEKKMFI